MILYKEGKYVNQDLNETVKLYRQAALLGSSEAMLSLSAMYKEGDGVSQNKAEADFYKRMTSFDDYQECHDQLKAKFDPNSADQVTPLFVQNEAVQTVQTIQTAQSETSQTTELETNVNNEEKEEKDRLGLLMLGVAAFFYFFTSVGLFKSILYAFGAAFIIVLIDKFEK